MTGAYAQWLLRFSYFALRGWFVLLLDENSICFFFFVTVRGRLMAGMPEFWALVEMQASEQFRRLPSKCVRSLMTYCVLTSANSDRLGQKEAMAKVTNQ
jgi:hypothetical protein